MIGLATGGSRRAYVLDMSKFQLMTDWLDAEKVLLLRSPPGSGKTSFAVRFAVYLNDYVSVAYFMKASRMLQRLDNGMSMDDVWKKELRLSLQDICHKSRDRHIYIIIDEAQAWYPANRLRKKVKNAGGDVLEYAQGYKGTTGLACLYRGTGKRCLRISS
jgi:KaiC/GvpD/RAD55 family RecA-like ATPase